MARFTNKGLVAFVKWMAEKNCPYWFACYGQTASRQLLEKMLKSSYKSQYTKWPISSFESQFGQKVADCSGEIKSYFMNPTVGDDGFATDPAKDSVYNSKYDLSANMLEAQAKEKGAISTIPEIEGIIVWKDGHCGVYIGGGYVIEERGHSYGTVRTKLSDRPWTKWLKHPMLEYVANPAPSPAPVPSGDGIKMPELKRGIKCDEVTLFQMAMNNLGYKDANGDPLEIDGSFGGKSECVCIQFQKDYGLTADGICGSSTWKKILHLRYKNKQYKT